MCQASSGQTALADREKEEDFLVPYKKPRASQLFRPRGDPAEDPQPLVPSPSGVTYCQHFVSEQGGPAPVVLAEDPGFHTKDPLPHYRVGIYNEPN